jgi:hypothetical protein
LMMMDITMAIMMELKEEEEPMLYSYISTV